MSGNFNARSGFLFEDEVCINKFLLAYLNFKNGLRENIVENPKYEKIDFAILFSESSDIYQVKDKEKISSDDFVAIVKEFIAIKEKGRYKNPNFYLVCSQKLKTQWIRTLRWRIEESRERRIKLSYNKLMPNIVKRIKIIESLFPNFMIEIEPKESIERDSLGCLHKIPEISNRIKAERHKELLSILINHKIEKLINRNYIFSKKNLEYIFKSFSNDTNEHSQLLEKMDIMLKQFYRVEKKIDILPKNY